MKPVMLVLASGLAGLCTLPIATAAVSEEASTTRPEMAARQALLQAYPLTQFTEHGSRLTRVFGAAFSEGPSAIAAADQFRLNHAAIFGVEPADLHPVSILPDGRHTQGVLYDGASGNYKFTMVYYSQHKAGIPVYRADLRLLARNQAGSPIVLAAANLRPLHDFQPQIKALTPAMVEMAHNSVKKEIPSLVNFSEPALVIWAGVDDMIVQPAVAVEFVADNRGAEINGILEQWRFLVDALSGAILHREDMTLEIDVSGNISGFVTDGIGADICEEEVQVTLPYTRASIGTTVAYADANGDYTIPNDGAGAVNVSSGLRGEYFRVFNNSGSDTVQSALVLPPGPADFVHNLSNNNEFYRAEVNGYREANVVRDWIIEANPDYPVIADQSEFPVNVNQVGGICPGNAQYTFGAINFCAAGGGSPNTSWSSVVHHEYGHHLVESGGSGQGQYGEGMGDVMSVIILDNSLIGVGLFGDCGQALRDADNDMQYPCTGEAHFCGQLIAGCVWSTRNLLIDSEPQDYSKILMSLAVNAVLLHNGSGIAPEITVDWLTLDDDDAEIGNGTPHYQAICGGFNAHNMDCPPLNAVGFDYPAGNPDSVLPDQQTVIPVIIVPITGQAVPDSGTVSYRVGDSGPFTTLPMTLTGPDEYEATLPALRCLDSIQYYFGVQAEGIGLVTDPSDAPASTYSAIAVTGIEVSFADDFEADLGWTVGAPDDDATTGIWNLMDPEGTAAQPENDHTPAPGTKCWVTDGFAGSSLGDFDVDDGKTTLFSPPFDASTGGEKVSYWRWYSNDTGGGPNADVFVVDISNNGGVTWSNVETVGPSGPGTSGGWVYHEFYVADVITPTANMVMRFVASDESFGSLVEAALDDFTVETLLCGGPCPADLNGDGGVGAEDLADLLAAWGPNPGHPADLDGDGIINASDLAMLLAGWGPCP